MGRILAFDARGDAFAIAAGQYRRTRLYPELSAGNATLEMLEGQGVTQATLRAALAPGPPGLLTGSGHGRAGALFGDAFDLVLNVDRFRRHVPELPGSIVHLLACKSARELGRALVAAGAAAFIGYDSDFYYDERCPELFFACDAEIVRGLANGLGVGAALTRARASFAAAIERLRREGKPYAAAMLQFNLNHLCGPDRDAAFGDPGAVLATIPRDEISEERERTRPTRGSRP